MALPVQVVEHRTAHDPALPVVADRLVWTEVDRERHPGVDPIRHYLSVDRLHHIIEAGLNMTSVAAHANVVTESEIRMRGAPA